MKQHERINIFVNNTKIWLIVPLIIVFFSMSCATAEPKNVAIGRGESSPLLSGTSWEYSEDNTGNSVYYVKFNEDGNATWYDTEDNVIHHLTAESIWERQGNIIRISHNAGYRYIEGSLITGTNPRKITGAGRNSHNNEWKFTMIER